MVPTWFQHGSNMVPTWPWLNFEVPRLFSRLALLFSPVPGPKMVVPTKNGAFFLPGLAFFPRGRAFFPRGRAFFPPGRLVPTWFQHGSNMVPTWFQRKALEFPFLAIQHRAKSVLAAQAEVLEKKTLPRQLPAEKASPK